MQEATTLLRNFKKSFDPLLETYFKEKIKQAGEIDSVAEEAVYMIRDYTMSGGKRIRPAFLYYGYLAAGGKEMDKIMSVSLSVELLHSFLLIHDDIIDRDETRHGVDTMHEKFKKIAKRYGIAKDHEHFGNSMAMIAGDMTAAMACDIIFNSDFSSDIIVSALHKLQNIVFVTIPGEMLDVIMEYSGRATEDEIMKMYEGKTARYTFEGPLHLGCILAGVKDNWLSDFSCYALPLGKAFQIQDDLLGVFGDEKKLGKPVGSDIIEGKQTVLVVRALGNGNREQKNIIKNLLGKKDLSMDELELFRKTVVETKALDYCQKLAERYTKEALEALRNIDFKNKEAKVFLSGMANYIIKREI